jgi:hypothetical protein
MKWKVLWNSHAEDAVANYWLNASSQMRAKITAAVGQTDELLSESPETLGESRETGQRRIVFVDPLSITFEVRSLEHVANVLSAHLFNRRK